MGPCRISSRASSTSESLRAVSCDLTLEVTEATELVFQIAAATSAGSVLSETLEFRSDGAILDSVDELGGPHGARVHAVRVDRGRLTVAYRAEIDSAVTERPERVAKIVGDLDSTISSPDFSEILYLRPSRYCPTDRFGGFATAEFGTGGDVAARVVAIADWIRRRIEYLPGSGSVHDTAEDTLLAGTGTCRDFAHLGVALCRAVGVAARFTAVYAPGLVPMDFHAVFETRLDGRWYVHDPTGLAPRASMVRIATGRDAADAAFASIERGAATLTDLEVRAEVGSALLPDQLDLTVELS